MRTKEQNKGRPQTQGGYGGGDLPIFPVGSEGSWVRMSCKKAETSPPVEIKRKPPGKTSTSQPVPSRATSLSQKSPGLALEIPHLHTPRSQANQMASLTPAWCLPSHGLQGEGAANTAAFCQAMAEYLSDHLTRRNQAPRGSMGPRGPLR